MRLLHSGSWREGLYTEFQVCEITIPVNSNFKDVHDIVVGAVGGTFQSGRLWACLGEEATGHYQEIVEDKDVQWLLALISMKVIKSYSIVVHVHESSSAGTSGGHSFVHRAECDPAHADPTNEVPNMDKSPGVEGQPASCSNEDFATGRRERTGVCNDTTGQREHTGVPNLHAFVYQAECDSEHAEPTNGMPNFKKSPRVEREPAARFSEEFGTGRGERTDVCNDTAEYTTVCEEHDSSINYDIGGGVIDLQIQELSYESGGMTVIGDCPHPQDKRLFIKEGMLFLNKVELKKFLHFYAIKNNLQFKITRSCSRRVQAICINQPCSWKLCAYLVPGCAVWSIRRLNVEHSCYIELVTSEHRQANPFIISEYVSELFSMAGVGGMKPNDIISHMRFNHGVHVTYLKAWRTRELAFSKIHGSAFESYSLIPTFKEMIMKMNLGSVVEWVLDIENRFKYLFIALFASVEGWRRCRPVLSVDGTFMKNKYGGTLLVASTIDGNNQIFPLAFVVVDSENDDSRRWFFSMLGSTLSLRGEFSVISDRHKSIMKAVSHVFPDAHHGICMYHLASNIISKFKKKSLLPIFNRCAKSYSVAECQKFLSMLDGICPGLKKYLMDIGLHKWSRAHFRGMQYNIMTTNTSESFNARIREARSLPILALLMELRNILQQWFYDRRCAANAMATHLTTWADKQLRDEMCRANHSRVKCVDLSQYEVYEGISSHVVDTRKGICSCRKWQVEQLPCSHACAALKYMNVSPNQHTRCYCTKETLIQTYRAQVSPIGTPTEWEVPEEIKGISVNPPNVRRPTGRPRSTQFLNHMERRERKKCGRCGGRGHNRESCRNPIPALI